MNKITILLLLLASQIVLAQSDCENQPWLDHTLPLEERVESMINCMTVEEKISQLMNESDAIPRLGIEQYNWWSEALHGVARSGRATVFPQSIGLGATFDPDLIRRVGTAISDEARAINNQLVADDKKYIRYMGLSFWSPNVNIFRDPRWGRGQETYGEDPYLSGAIGASFVKGMQGNHPRYLKTAACAKHFVVHSGPEELRHEFNAIATPKDMYETYLPAFKSCVDAGVEAVMCAYNRTNHEACCGSNYLLQEILRDDWGFNGHVVSDCGAIRNFHNDHKITENAAESAALAIKSGVNVNCGDTYDHLDEALSQGLIAEPDIDKALRPLVRTRFKLGMFDPRSNNPYTSIPTYVINSQEHKDLARETAQKSVVLLQNKNNILPLKKDLPFVYMSGPFAADVRALLGNYNGLSNDMVTVVEGIVNKVSPATRVQYRSGAMVNTPNSNPHDWYSGLAKKADATIAVVGLTVLLEGEEGEAIASEYHGDNITMKLPENQINFLKKLREGNEKPLIVVVAAGCPVDLTEVNELADAVIYSWYPGEQGGNAIADIIFGDVSPSGKLPITFPKSADQLPPYEDYSMEGRTYKYMEEEPLYPFGYGLTYSSIVLNDLQSDATTAKAGENFPVKIKVENNGQYDTEEVVQLYVSLMDTKTKVPQSSLQAIKRVTVKQGEHEEVEFMVKPEMFYYIDEEGNSIRHKGKAKLIIGNASPGSRSEALGASFEALTINVK